MFIASVANSFIFGNTMLVFLITTTINSMSEFNSSTPAAHFTLASLSPVMFATFVLCIELKIRNFILNIFLDVMESPAGLLSIT